MPDGFGGGAGTEWEQVGAFPRVSRGPLPLQGGAAAVAQCGVGLLLGPVEGGLELEPELAGWLEHQVLLRLLPLCGD